jgi:hypothetical protein
MNIRLHATDASHFALGDLRPGGRFPIVLLSISPELKLPSPNINHRSPNVIFYWRSRVLCK